jgi:hypothetical protein
MDADRDNVIASPDKNQGIKGANERYARLGVVAQILRSEGRERYVVFFAPRQRHGVWKNSVCLIE